MSLHADQWIQVVNAGGTWVAGIGTVGAVIVALRLARNASRLNLKTTLDVYIMVTPGGNPPTETCVGFAVVNLGERAAIVSSVGWSIGKGEAKRFAVQKLEPRLGADAPKRLEHGESANFMFSLDPTWPAYFVNGFVTDLGLLPTLRGLVTTTTDRTVEIKPSERLLKRLRTALDEQTKLPEVTVPTA